MTVSRVHYSVLVDVFRPHWEKCGQYVEGGADRWNALSQDRSSDELVDILLAEMTGQDIAIIQAGVNTGAEYFTGQVYNLKYLVGRAHPQISSSPGLQVGLVTSECLQSDYMHIILQSSAFEWDKTVGFITADFLT